MTKKVHPTLAEDMSLARNGGIRTEEGQIEQVGLKEAYKIIDQRKRSSFYNLPSVDLDEDDEEPTLPEEIEDEPEESNVVKPEPVPEQSAGDGEPDSEKPGGPGEPGPEQSRPFTRGKVTLRKFTRKGSRRKSGRKSSSRKSSKSAKAKSKSKSGKSKGK